MLAIDLPNVLAELFRLVGAGAAAFLVVQDRRIILIRSGNHGRKTAHGTVFGSGRKEKRPGSCLWIGKAPPAPGLRPLSNECGGHEILALWLARVVLGCCGCPAVEPGRVGAALLFDWFRRRVLLVNGMKETAWQAVKADLEREVPIFLNSFISSIQVTATWCGPWMERSRP